MIVERFFDRRIARRESRRTGLRFRVGKKYRVDPIKPRRAYDLIAPDIIGTTDLRIRNGRITTFLNIR